MKFLCRATEHKLSQEVLEAFAHGTPGTFISLLRGATYPEEIPVYYGILRGCKDAIHEDMRVGRPWVYIDHGYFGDKDNENLTGHYRIVVGGLHHKIPEWPGPLDRECGSAYVAAMSPMQPMPRGAPVVLVPPTNAVADFYGIGVQDWVGRFRGNLVICTKGSCDLDAYLKNCDRLISHSSTASIKALMMGIPGECTADRAPVPNHGNFGRSGLVSWLAERQFTLEEIRNGRHNEHLRREIEAFEADRKADA